MVREVPDEQLGKLLFCGAQSLEVQPACLGSCQALGVQRKHLPAGRGEAQRYYTIYKPSSPSS